MNTTTRFKLLPEPGTEWYTVIDTASGMAIRFKKACIPDNPSNKSSPDIPCRPRKIHRHKKKSATTSFFSHNSIAMPIGKAAAFMKSIDFKYSEFSKNA